MPTRVHCQVLDEKLSERKAVQQLVKNWKPDYLPILGSESAQELREPPPSWPWSKLENAANDSAFRAHRSPIDRHSLANRATLEQAQWEILNREKQEVLAQPHRNGSLSQLRESALGRFVEDYQCGNECFEAGRQYMLLVFR